MNKNIAAALILAEERFGWVSKVLDARESLENTYEELTTPSTPEGYSLVKTYLTGREITSLAGVANITPLEMARALRAIVLASK